ncbi:MAG: hypothetical protein HY876_11040 [Coriobacteriales bacterium]|nr:hypothetical protein [Coriobacteriales bacterium]
MSGFDQEPSRLRRVLGRVDLRDLGDPLAEIGLFAGASDLSEIERRLRDHVAQEVEAALALTEEFDAFDVIELMRQRELPISPVLGLSPDFDGSGAAIELVTLVLLARGKRKPSSTPREETRPNEAIPELHDRAKRLLRLAIYRAKACEFMRGRDPLARLSAEYQSYLVGVRALQYESVQAEHERSLFDRPEIDRVMRTQLGFTHREFVAVRDAIQDRYSCILTDLRDVTADIFVRADAERREPTPGESEILARSLIDMMFLPAERAAFTAADVADHGALDLNVVQRVLDCFSLDFDSSADATTRVVNFLHARNPLARQGLVRADGKHVLVSGPIGADSFRATAEQALKNTPDWGRYDATRRDVSEALAVVALERALDSPPFATNLKYFAPAPDLLPKSLGRGCPSPEAVGVVVESDALFVIDDVAVCLEVKARSVAEQARRGDRARLETEIKNIMGSGAHQARRLESLICDNGGVWDANGFWIDLSHVREIRTVVAGLDYFGPLGVALGDLADGDLVGQGSLPWIASIHDLDVISRVIDRPAEFLLYLRRRTASGVARHYRGSDELDLFMLFLGGGLYVEDDPDEIYRAHPRAAAPTRTARDRYEQAAQPTLVGTYTDPLDAWMYWVEGSSPDRMEKPVFNVDSGAAELVDFLADGAKPGWLRIGADVLGLNGRSQRKLLANVQRVVDQTCADARPHSLTQGFAGADGYMTFFVGTVPAGADRAAEADRLCTYMLAKKHQIQSDRSLGLLISHRGRIETTMYLNDPPCADDDLDALGAAMGLRRTWEPSRPPSVSEKKRKRRARRRRRP